MLQFLTFTVILTSVASLTLRFKQRDQAGNMATPVEVSVVCPGSQSSCPDGSTCCPLSSGEYGCCPIPDAVCCSDHLHCCPNGYTCDVSAGTCTLSDGLAVPWMIKEPARGAQKPPATPVEVSSVPCGGTSTCPDGTTCCLLSSGGYGCCPFPSAVCCSDGTHCCPQGYTCDTGAGTCTLSGGLTVPWMSKEPARGAQKLPVSAIDQAVRDNVQCPDRITSCSQGTTCCEIVSGYYGCCLELVRAKPVEVSSVPCDAQSQCPDGKTCCPLPSGGYGCCPSPNAVCCSDGIHCCPFGTTCDVSTGQCYHSNGPTMPWMSKEPSRGAPNHPELPEVPAVRDNVQGPDGAPSCPPETKSCGSFCCPLVEGTCCSDMDLCCPSGYTCDKSGCTKDGSRLWTPLLSHAHTQVKKSEDRTTL